MRRIEDEIKQTTDLAYIYAQDGAFNRAAQLLEEAATAMKEHAEYVNEMWKDMKQDANH